MPERPPPPDIAVPTEIDRAEALLAAGQIADARRICETILRDDPSGVEANYLLGVADMAEGDLAAAEQQFVAVTTADPSHEDGWLRRGAALIALGRFAEAADCLRRLLALSPDDGAGLMHYGFCLSCLGDFAIAAAVQARAHALSPDHDTVLFLYASALTWTEGPASAMRCFASLTERAPDFAPGGIGKALLHLLLGEYTIGWAMYEARLNLPEHEATARVAARDRWHGAVDQRGKTVLLHADAGFGDIIQFARYVPMVAERGMRVLLRVPPSLVRLLRDLPGVAAIVPDNRPPPPFDLQCPITSLPLAFDTTLATIPAHDPALAAPADAVATWSGRLAGVPGPRVGLVWASGARPGQISSRAHGMRKSLPLMTLAPLAAVPDVTFVSLQLGPAASEASRPPAGMVLLDVTPDIADFADTAAIIASLDLVISVDTAVAHLAGAMRRPVWLMNPFDSDWRWMLDRHDNPWYPTMRIFRQPTSGDWASVANAVAAALRARYRP